MSMNEFMVNKVLSSSSNGQTHTKGLKYKLWYTITASTKQIVRPWCG